MKKKKRKAVVKRSVPQGDHNTTIQITVAPAAPTSTPVMNDADTALMQMRTPRNWRGL